MSWPKKHILPPLRQLAISTPFVCLTLPRQNSKIGLWKPDIGGNMWLSLSHANILTIQRSFKSHTLWGWYKWRYCCQTIKSNLCATKNASCPPISGPTNLSHSYHSFPSCKILKDFTRPAQDSTTSSLPRACYCWLASFAKVLPWTLLVVGNKLNVIPSLTWCILVHLWTSPGVRIQTAVCNWLKCRSWSNWQCCTIQILSLGDLDLFRPQDKWNQSMSEDQLSFKRTGNTEIQFSTETSFTKRDPFWKLSAWAILLLLRMAEWIWWYKPSEDEVWSWSRKWEHNMAQEYIHRFIRCISTSNNAFCI